MPARVYAPGSDAAPRTDQVSSYNPQNGAGGIFAEYLQGATPKYAKNQGTRETQQRNTMARMFIRVDQADFPTFKQSVGDQHTRSQLVDRIAGDPLNPRRVGETIVDTGYMDFLLLSVQQGFQEKVQVSETLADNYVAYFFGQSAPMWTFSGALINSVQDDQHSNFMRVYLHLARGTQLARRQTILSIKYDSFVVAGAMTNFNSVLESSNELLIRFSFQLLVKRVFITNFTAGWVPTRPIGRFSADPLAVAYDGRPTEDRAPEASRLQIPPDTDEGPGGYETRDSRNNQTNPGSVEGSDPYVRDSEGNAIGQRAGATTPPVVSQTAQSRDDSASVISEPQLSDQNSSRNSDQRSSS